MPLIFVGFQMTRERLDLNSLGMINLSAISFYCVYSAKYKYYCLRKFSVLVKNIFM